jgi:multiple sugar transport system ATP-binding protein
MNLVPAPLIGAGGDGQVAGFRPERVDLGNGRPDCVHCGARVEVVEYLGDEQVVHLRVGDTLVQAKLHADYRIEHGTDVVLAVPRERLVLFDAESGERVVA